MRGRDLHETRALGEGREPSLCVAIEDSRWGIESAKTAGLRCVGITQTYEAGELASADAVIASLDDFTVDLVESLVGR